jgi:CheY-like chemotaxis protein
MGQAQQTRGAVLIVEDDAELRSLTVALLEDEQLDTIECESAEAALAVMLIGGQHVALIFADIRLRGVMDGIDLAHEVRVRWPLLPVVLTSGHPRRVYAPIPARCRLHTEALAAAQFARRRRRGANISALNGGVASYNHRMGPKNSPPPPGGDLGGGFARHCHLQKFLNRSGASSV